MANLFDQYRGSGRQFQREATPFERVMDALQVPVQGLAGGLDAALAGENPLEGAADYIREDQDFTNIFLNTGMDSRAAAALGFATNVAADPLNYVGVGLLSKAGKVARGARLAFDVAEDAGDIGAAAKAAKTIDDVGVYSTKLSEQAAAGHRTLFTFAGQKIVGGERVFRELERVGDFVGNSPAGTTLRTVFGSMKSRLPDFVKFRQAQAKAKAGRAALQLEGAISTHKQEYYQAMAEAGIDATTAKEILSDAIERGKTNIDTTDLTQYMSEHDRRKYVRLVWQAEAAKRGLPDQLAMSGPGKGDKIFEEFLSRRRRPNKEAVPGMVTPGTAQMEGVVDAAENVNLAAGRKVRRVDKIRAAGVTDEGGEVVKQGKSGKLFIDATGLGIPNLFIMDGAHGFQGRVSSELLEHLSRGGKYTNSVKALRRIEQRAIEEYASLHTGRNIKAVLQKYGWDSQLAKLSPKIAKAVSFINATNAGFLAAERKSGIRVSELAGDLNYLHRLLTPEGRDAIVASLGNEASKISSTYDVSVRFGAQLERDDMLRSLTLNEINELSERGMLALTGNKKVKLFEDEAFFATYQRGSSSARSVESAQMVNSFITKYGNEVTGTVDKPLNKNYSAPVGHSFLPDRIAEDLGIRHYESGRLVRDVALPNDVVGLLQSHYERVLSPAGLQPALRGYDALTRMWKNITLPIWPAYQIRNGLSDLIMMTHGADDYALGIPQAVGAIKDASYGLMGKSKTVDIGGGRTVSWDDFAEILHSNGVLDYNAGREIEDLIIHPKELVNFHKGLLGLEERLAASKPFDIAVRVSAFRQNATNAGYFLGLLRNGHAPEVAAMEVKKRLFDFSDLTDIEKQVFRRVAPFYSWLRHNIPYQVQAAIRRPAIVSQLGWLRNAMTGGEGPAGDVALPGWLAEGVPIAMGGTGELGKPNFARLKGLVPQADVAALGQPLQEAVNAVSPLLKTPVEVASNYSFFRNQPLERYPGEPSLLGIPGTRRYLEPALDQIRFFNEAQNLMRDQGLAAKVSGLTVAKGYAIDTNLQSRLMYYKLEQERTRVKKLIYQAASKGDSGAIIQLRNYLRHIERNPRQLLK